MTIAAPNNAPAEPAHSVRSDLRSGTAAEHARVDELIGRYDLASQHGLAAYLSISHLAYTFLSERMEPRPGFSQPPMGVSEIEADLRTLGRTTPCWRQEPNVQQFHPVGVTYVIAGSHLGGSVLHRQWQETVDPVVRRADQFMTHMANRDCWIVFQKELSGANISQLEYFDILESAKRCFAVFEAACQTVMKDSL